jgi:hypothetical protein
LERANILTGLRTHAVNITSNAVHSTVEGRITQAIASVLPGGVGLSAHRKAMAEAVAGSVAPMMVAAEFALAQESLVRQFEILMESDAETRLLLQHIGGNKWMDKNNAALPGMFGKVVRTYGFSTLGAEDALFKTVPFRYALALQKAKGQQPDYLAAMKYAEDQVFQKELGDLAGPIVSALNKYPAVELLLQIFFKKTLINLTKRAFDYTPVLGVLKNTHSLRGQKGVDARNLAAARQIVGFAIAAIALGLSQGGDDEDEDSMIMGFGPVGGRSSNDRKLFNAAYGGGLAVGETGGYKIDMSRLDPFSTHIGLTFGLVSAGRAMWTGEGDAGSIILQTGLAAVLNKSFLAQPAEIATLATQGESGRLFDELCTRTWSTL